MNETSRGPLAGLKVVELAGIGPGPYACMLLAELGADVIRVERPGTPASKVPLGAGLERSRPSIAVDLKSDEGRELVLRLVERADVLIEGGRPGVTERLGLGPDDCLSRNPSLVYGRMTGWGQEGPLAQTAGHDIIYAALSGALHPTGTREQPMPALNLVADFGGGTMFLLLGVLSALFERGTSGRGQVVDAAMVDGAASLTTMIHAMLGIGAWRDERRSNMLDGGAPFYDTYECADGKHVAVGAIEPQFYAELLDGLGVRDVISGHQMDESRWEEHRALFAETFRTRTRDEWAETFAPTDACVAPVLSLTEAPAHPHLVERGTFVEVEGVTVPRVAPRFSRTPGLEPAARSEDASAVLTTWGVDGADVQRLVESGLLTAGAGAHG